MNESLGESSLAKDVFDTVFTKWWPELQDRVSEVLRLPCAIEVSPRREVRDLLEEILALVRENASRSVAPRFREDDIAALTELYYDLVDHAADGRLTAPVKSYLSAIGERLAELAGKVIFNDPRAAEKVLSGMRLLEQIALVDE